MIWVIYIYNFSCQNLYCFRKNASLVIRKQPINHLKLVCNITDAWPYWNRLPVFIFCRVPEVCMNVILKFWKRDLNKNKAKMDAIGICSLLLHVAVSLACSEVIIFLQAMKQRFQIFFQWTLLYFIKITSRYLLLSSTLVAISGES